MKYFLAAAMLAALAACSGKEAREASPGISLLKGLSVSETDAAGRKWALDSSAARMDEKKGLMYFTSPLIKVYQNDALSSEITSRNGFLQMKEKEAQLTGDVRVNSKKDGMRLETTRLFYSSARGKIWTEEPVTIYQDRSIIKGRGFAANPDLSEIEIRHQETRMRAK